MNEITILDALLLAGAVIATVKALGYRKDVRTNVYLLNRLLADDTLRDRIVADYKKVFGNK